ncbi:TPA: hypothetical protein ACGHLQ_003540 [Salmonella enterica subsp. enterica]
MAESVALTVVCGVRERKINNPVAYLLTLLRQAREGRFRLSEGGMKSATAPPPFPSTTVPNPAQSMVLNEQQGRIPEKVFVPAPKEVLAAKLAEARAALQVNRR